MEFDVIYDGCPPSADVPIANFQIETLPKFGNASARDMVYGSAKIERSTFSQAAI